ncbi:MAG: S-methyl-5'-thioadenosine phosphorylase [Planctomycetota bacterium]|nr:S-methyl-5'-thioadenosine phosphorylase [Planctomycetota bacterium]
MHQGASAEIGIIGGTGLYDMHGLEDVRELTLETPYGPPSSVLRTGRLEGRDVVFLARHGPGHRLLPTEIPYRANIYALKLLGVSKILAVSAVGSLVEELPPRSLVVPDQFLDRTRHRPDTFYGDGLVAHVSMAEPFAPALRTALIESARGLGHDVRDGGTQICMEGPQFSTRAESLIWKGLGCHVIGMTAMTEARLAREAEIGYATLNLVTDYDAWRPEEAGVDTAEILAVLSDNADVAKAVLHDAVARVPEGPLPENGVLKTALITPLDKVPPSTVGRLQAILAPYLD